ncbi:MAG: DUF5011 domain-containing protein [Clostridiales bacterium]|nr:DUF5011 domain-containing protein [Clostridiales bacterium]
MAVKQKEKRRVAHPENRARQQADPARHASQGKSNWSQRTIVVAIVICVTALGAVAFGLYYRSLPVLSQTPSIVEAGAAAPPPSAWFSKNGANARYAKGTPPDTSKVGKFNIELAAAGRTYGAEMEVIDTTPPDVSIHDAILINDEPCVTETFAVVKDATVKFEIEPTLAFGKQEVFLEAIDDYGNSTKKSATLYRIEFFDSLTFELGEVRSLSITDFVPNSYGCEAIVLEMPLGAQLSVPGSYEAIFSIGGRELKATVDVKDTTPPTAKPLKLSGWVGDKFEPADFCSDITDLAEVETRFAIEPDWEKTGEQAVGIELVDASGNVAEVAATLALKRDVTPPEIKGVTDRTIMLGQTMLYRSGVTVTDDRDEDIELQIDSSKVDIETEGTYRVTYYATDRAGNTASVAANLEVFETSTEVVDAMADEILQKIGVETMNTEGKIRAIWKWVRSNLAYLNPDTKHGVYPGAYYGLKKRSGDCYTFYAVSEVLLTRAGVETMGITRIPGRTKHYWNLVKSDEGLWYHFDSVPYTGDSFNTAMFTESQAEEYTAKRRRVTPNCYVYDHTLYPEVTR